jgi:uncharacterized membrane protein
VSGPVAGGPVLTEGGLRAILFVVAAYHVITGVLALLAPDTFFDDIGRYGIENSHYVGDVGAFQLAFGLALLIAALRPAWRAPILYLGALWYALHALNHLFDIDEARSDARGAADTILIALGAALTFWLARVSERPATRAGPAQ